MSEKILGKYEIIAPKDGENEFKVKTAKGEFRIKRVAKGVLNDGASNSHYFAPLLTQSERLKIEHKNLKCVSIDEDENYFYAITPMLESEEFTPLKRNFFHSNGDIDYERLVECYLQIFDAIKSSTHKVCITEI